MFSDCVDKFNGFPVFVLQPQACFLGFCYFANMIYIKTATLTEHSASTAK